MNQSVDHWLGVIQNVLAGGALDGSSLSRGEEPHLVLLSVYNSLDELEKVAFRDAVAVTLETVTPDRPASCFYVLQLVAAVKPVRSKRILRRKVLEEVLAGREFGAYDLHALLISVLSRFDVDDDLMYYIQRRFPHFRDTRLQLASIRAVAIRDPAIAMKLIVMMLPFLGSSASRKQVERVLTGIVEREGSKFLHEWYVENERKIDAAFTNGFQDSLLIVLEEVIEIDPYAKLLLAEIRSSVEVTRAEALAEIGGLAEDIDPDAVAQSISRIVQRQDANENALDFLDLERYRFAFRDELPSAALISDEDIAEIDSEADDLKAAILCRATVLEPALI